MYGQIARINGIRCIGRFGAYIIMHLLCKTDFPLFRKKYNKIRMKKLRAYILL